MKQVPVTECDSDGVNRRGFLRCMSWAGSGVVWSIAGGIPSSELLGQTVAGGGFHFVQISDSHIGFKKPANSDVNATLKLAIDKVNALPETPAFLIHTGDLTHTSKPAEFDTLDQLLRGVKAQQAFYVPGEHDNSVDDGKEYLARFGKGTQGTGWYSFDQHGVHFVGLVNSAALEGLGKLGAEQLAWLKRDLNGKASSTPVVVFAHLPLWTIYREWGWGTADSEEALGYLKRFGSVTVLNGHIHQSMQKVEGNVRFHTAMSTAFPQAAPGQAPGPGPMKVPAEKLSAALGISRVELVQSPRHLAIIDSTLESE